MKALHWPQDSSTDIMLISLENSHKASHANPRVSICFENSVATAFWSKIKTSLSESLGKEIMKNKKDLKDKTMAQ